MNNKAIIEFGFRRPSASVDNTLLDLQNFSYPTQLHSLIAKYQERNMGKRDYGKEHPTRLSK